MKNNKGVSLISLVVAVIILLLLSSVTITSNREAHSVIRLQSFISKMKIIQAKVDEIAENENYIFPDELKMTDTNEYYSDFQNVINILKEDESKSSWVTSPEEVSDEDITNYYCFTPENLEEKLGIKHVDVTVIINFKTRNVIAKDGVTVDGKKYYRQYDVGSGEKRF